jgi:hypothetical protein
MMAKKSENKKFKNYFWGGQLAFWQTGRIAEFLRHVLHI